jgi:two-component system, sensor histidine kinase and response regulator
MLNEKPQLTPEMLVPRLGDALVQAGHLTTEQLQRALDLQVERQHNDQPILLGQALLELGLLDRATLDRAVTEQIIELRSALQSANRTLDRRVRERTEELQQALERLSELGEMKANFVANISHELRTPLTHIKGYLELLSSGSLGTLTDEQHHALQVSRKASSRLEKLIEDLLMFSRASHGEVSFRQETLDIRALATSAVDATSAKAAEAGVDLRLVAAERMPFVQGDGEKIRWVLDQLLDNAVKFTPAGGHVMLGIKPESDTLVIVSVRDTGIGIPESRLKEIFEPFRQLNGSSKRRAGGTGLGLALARQIVEAHGSVLEVKSIEGQGTTIQFPLLVATESRADAHPSAS